MTHPSPKGVKITFHIPGVGGHSGGSFDVDLENAPTMIPHLEAAVAQLEKIDNRAKAAGNVPSPMGDPYSAWAIREISRRASDEDGCHGAANKALQDVIKGMIGKIRSTMRTYGMAEDANASVQQGLQG